MCIQNQADGVIIKLRVQPRASKNRIAGTMGDALKVAVTAPPVDGEANTAIVGYFSEILKIPKSRIEIINGHTGRNKLIKVFGINAEQVREKLER